MDQDQANMQKSENIPLTQIELSHITAAAIAATVAKHILFDSVYSLVRKNTPYTTKAQENRTGKKVSA